MKQLKFFKNLDPIESTLIIRSSDQLKVTTINLN